MSILLLHDITIERKNPSIKIKGIYHKVSPSLIHIKARIQALSNLVSGAEEYELLDKGTELHDAQFLYSRVEIIAEDKIIDNRTGRKYRVKKIWDYSAENLPNTQHYKCLLVREH